MTVKALKKKNKMSGPFKLKSGNSPLFKNLGSSPVRNDKFADKKTESNLDVQRIKHNERNN